jgi:hypothetical protein
LSRREKKAKATSRLESKAAPREANGLAGESAQPATNAGREPIAATRRSARPLLAVAAIVAGTWWVALAVLAVFTSNPVTLNRVQILSADYLASGTVVDLSAGEISIEKEWKQRGLAGRIHVDNLPPTGARQGRAYLLPLEKIGVGGFRVAPTKLPGQAPLIYPATGEAFKQLSALLAEQIPDSND